MKAGVAGRSRAISTTRSIPRRVPSSLRLTLSEFVAATPEAHRGLIGYLASLSDQVQEIHLLAPADNSWLGPAQDRAEPRARSGNRLTLDTGNVAAGAMLRLTDVKLGLETLPIAKDARGELVLEVEDPVLAQNARA